MGKNSEWSATLKNTAAQLCDNFKKTLILLEFYGIL
mgnify:CR=1 FL=1